jgi:SAM-dependent methyltransferase
MSPIAKLFQNFSSQARAKRAELFRNSFVLDDTTKILDLGSESGSNINAILIDTNVKHENVYIADIDSTAVNKGHTEYGFVPVLIDESEKLPFEDRFFDIVFCSSVIEHITVPKADVWSIRSGREFKVKSLHRQREFSREIERIGKQYFVQTPYKHFPIESHTWLPFIAWLPRWLLIPVLRLSNRYWLKKTTPDWYLLDKKLMRQFFRCAEIRVEKKFGLTKSLIAIRSNGARPDDC